jgi:hypothetical protein
MIMSTMRTRHPALAGLLTGALLAGVLAVLPACGGQETGISQRHLHGIVTLPPVPLWEAESTPKSNDDEANNDSLETADGPFSVTYGYHIIRGTSARTCAEITPDNTEVDCEGFLPSDTDFFRVRANYRGPLVIKARVAADFTGDVDLWVNDPLGNNLYADSNELTETLDEDGNVVLDEEGEPVMELSTNRFSTQVEGGEEFFIEVKINSAEGQVDYEVVIVGNNPNEHNEVLGIEGDVATYETGTDDPIFQDALEVLAGAYLSADIDNLGAPVAGTSCVDWNYDAETETFWCAWDMAFVHGVSIEASILLEGMRDGKDNDCDGIADDGVGDLDEDGDGYTIEQGDCNDHDAAIGPFRGDQAGDRKDNDCDGWADNGPDDVDDDGDGYCESGGVDINEDGVCRGPAEVGGSLGIGDCNDTDPAINPGLNVEIPLNSLDDNCTGGDAVLDLGTNTDNDNQGQHDWSDTEEGACGTSPFLDSPPSEVPQDLDEDELCDATCLGVVGCPQDTDGDGWHNIRELICDSDPADGDSVPFDFDNDGVCDAAEMDCGNDPQDPEDWPFTFGSGLCIGGDFDLDGDGVHAGWERLCGSDSTDGASVPPDADGDTICDAIEVAEGSDPADADDVPLDVNGDGLSDWERWACVGEADCPIDLDGDGVHNWNELLCGSDPESADSLPLDLDGDGICNGKDDDADGDTFINNTGQAGDDCNDIDPSIHPHRTDEVGVVLEYNYDVPNGIDDDCDRLIDENRDWIRADDGTFSQNTSYQDEDQDGDGYSLGLRDCNDTDPDIVLGNYETYSTNIVNSDFNTVHLFAGDVISLNQTMTMPDARRVTELVSVDMQKDRAAWAFAGDWEEGEPPILIPSGMPLLEAWFVKQPEVGKTWYEVEPNDTTIAGFDASAPIPWDEGLFQELGEAAGAGKTNELNGEISDIVLDTWSGDNDAFHVTFPEAGVLTASLDWHTAGGDYDAVFYCYFYNAVNPPAYYAIPFEPGLTDLSKPEEGSLIVPLPDGSDCWFFIVGYAGSAGAYTMSITPAGN